MVEGITVIVIIIAFAVIAVSTSDFFREVTDELIDDNTTLTDTAARGNLTSLDDRMGSNYDSIVVVMLGLLWLTSILFAFLIDTHPAFFVISFILFLGVLVAAGLVSDFWVDFATDSEIASEVNDDYPMTHFILNNFVLFVLAIGASVGIALYAKGR